MKWLLLALQLLPGILQTVKAVEEAIGPGQGKTKKELVLGAVQAGARAAQQVPEEHVQAVSALVDQTVKILNDSGVFQTGSPVAAGK